MKPNSFRSLVLPAVLASLSLALVASARADSVTVEAESGTLGADFNTGNDGGTQYITITSDSIDTIPGSAARVATYSVTFPAADTYDLFARVLVGSGNADDDSFFYGNGFGVKSPTSSADWITVNSVNVGGFTNPGDVVSGSGSSGITVWKWINLSEYTGAAGETPITFTVTAGNTNQTFQIGARENGFQIDKLVFGTSGYTFTVADLDSGSGGTNLPPGTGTCTVNWDNVHQRIDGFGASSAWNGSWTTAQADLLFSTNNNISYSGGTYNGVGLSLLRNRIVYANNTSANSTPTTVETSIMQMAQARGARVWSAPWTPAAGFKSTNNIYDSGTATGNGINGGSYLGSGNNATNQAYASQLANYVLSMKNLGINLYAISIQNEPDAKVTSYEACQWSGANIHDFVTNLYAALVAKGVGSTKIMLPESQNWTDPRNLRGPSLNDPNVLADVGIIANHNYVANNAVGDQTVPSAISSHGKALWETEVALLSGSDSSIANGVYWARRIYQYMTQAQANAFHYWWLTSSGNQGLIDTGAFPTKRLFTFGQYSRFVRPGFYRIDATSSQPSALISAYRATNSTAFAIVVVNTNAATDLIETFHLTNFTAASVTPWITSATLSLAPQTPVNVTNASFTYEVPAMSVVTFVGQAAVAPASVTIANGSHDPANPAFVLTWNSTSGATYSIFKTNALGGSSAIWPLLITGYPTGGAAGGALSYTDTTVNASSAFYRISSP